MRLFKNEKREFLTFIVENRWPIVLYSSIFLLLYCPWFIITYPRIDTELFLIDAGTFNNWLGIGRPGLVFSKYFLGVNKYNPFIASIFGYVLICLSTIFLEYNLWKHGNLNKVEIFIFALIALTSPILSEQFYFDCQLFEIAWTYVLVAGALLCSWKYILDRSIQSGVIAIILLGWAISSYQSFATVYIAIAEISFILYCQQDKNNKQTTSSCLKIICSLIILFTVTFLIDKAISDAFFMNAGYLQGLTGWNNFSIQACINRILDHGTTVFLGEGIFYSKAYGILSVLTVACVVFDCIVNRKESFIWYILATIAFQITPFILTIYMGNQPVIRAQIVSPIVLAGNVIIVLKILSQYRTLHRIAIFLSLVISWNQMLMTTRLVYTDIVRGTNDMIIAQSIQMDSNRYSKEKPVAFVGTISAKLNDSCIQGDLIGSSVFSWDLEPTYLAGTRRYSNIMRSLGYEYQPVTDLSLMQKARKAALEMPSYPNVGYIKELEECIVIKLSNDHWPQNIQ